MKLLVTGDRNWNDYEVIYNTLRSIAAEVPYPEPFVVINGGARGADSLSTVAARQLGLDVEEYPAKWETQGKAAGPIRNRQMLNEGKPDRVVAFHDDLAHSKGTRDMVEQARKRGLDVELISHG